MPRDILELYARSAPTDAHWYHEARDQVATRAASIDIDADRFAAIVAAVSPRQAWDTAHRRTPNLDVAERLVRDPERRATIGRFHADGVAILRGADPLEILRDKRRAFYLNLTRPGATDAVTIDSWMARAFGVAVTRRNYETLADIVRAAARAVGMSPDAFQACVWAQIRREAA